MCANHGALKKHHHEFEGINSRLDGLQAAVLSVKLRHIDKWTSMRIEAAEIYSRLLAGSSDLILPTKHEKAKHVFHLYVCKSNNRGELQSRLDMANISSGVHYPTALPYMNAYKYLNHTPADFPVAKKYADCILSLPIYPEITEDQLRAVASAISGTTR